MSFKHGSVWRLSSIDARRSQISPKGYRQLHVQPVNDRNRLSAFWTPAQRKDEGDGEHDGHRLLLRAGFLRQAHSGIFHLLPLGLRVQNKIESLIDRHMTSIGASKVSLSSISSQELWQRSGRLAGRDSEFFRLEDRKEAKYLLSPTHEEEITAIVANAVHSYRELPLRLYQVSRKYRDEARPRQGLLRGREFVMKDLYTFDVTETQAKETYEQVRMAYRAFLNDLRIPYAVADADSGNMGGNLSHEYHFLSSNGEDTIISCNSCDMVINEELYMGHEHVPQDVCADTDGYRSWRGLTLDRKTSVDVYVPDSPHEINIHAIKRQVPELDAGVRVSSDTPVKSERVVVLVDPRLPSSARSAITRTYSETPESPPATVQISQRVLTQLRSGDPCPRCDEGSVDLSQAVEIGHTFHLGTRYSTPLNAMVVDGSNQRVPIEMGCHGIGVSRLIGAVASLLMDSRGLNWPLAIAPFGALILGSSSSTALGTNMNAIYDAVTTQTEMDAVLDDRDRSMGWKLKDADAIGYPFIVVLGTAWHQRGAIELQCRRLGIREEVADVDELVQRLTTYKAQL